MSKLFTPEEKIEIVIEFKNSRLGGKIFAKKLNVTYATLLNWTHCYDKYGIEGFKRSKTSWVQENAQLRKELEETKKQLELNKVQTEMLKRLEEIIDRKK